MQKWDEIYDFVVAGSGGGGMMAAIVAHDKGLKTLIVEKSKTFGGSTSLSGGALWIPNNSFMKAEGIDDSEAEGITYMQAAIGDRTTKARQEAYIKVGPEMIDYIEKNTEVEFQRIPGYSDYYPELPGGNAIGRTLEPVPFNKKRLGDWRKNMNPPIWPLMEKFPVTGKEYHKMSMMRTTSAGKKQLAKTLSRLIKAKVTGQKTCSMGQALMGMMGLSVKNRNIPMWLNSPIKDLIVEDDKVVGAIIEKEGKTLRVKANKGVLLATGGFPHNQAMRDKYMQQPVKSEWSLANKTNEGDGINIGLKLDAAIDIMEDAWWGPASILSDGTPFFHVSERAQPGSIVVNKSGKRFTNEAKPYAEMVHILYEKNKEEEGSTIPCYIIFDSKFRKKYSFGIKPAGIVPKKDLESGYFTRANTIKELGEKIGVNAENLHETVLKYNTMAEVGKDTEFGKGDSAYDRYYGDPSVQPNPCMLPILKPPFYCVKLYPGDLGTKGGLVTNEKAEVLKTDGSVIKGLYATGNTAASVMGNTYPGAGATIGASMVFGFVAANEVASKVSDKIKENTPA